VTKFFHHLLLSRPLCVLDCETTGISPRHDRIVEIAIVRFTPQAEPDCFVRRLNPGMPIPPAATALHGIGDADVAACPAIQVVAPEIVCWLNHSDLLGFGITRFDLPLLLHELHRAKVPFSLDGRRVVDVLKLFRRLEPRHLSAAVRRYVGQEHQDAHRAISDAGATAAVLDGMLAAHSDLPRTVEQLHELLQEGDLAGRLRRDGGRWVFTFGKYAGLAVAEIVRRDAEYLAWLLRQDFLPDFKAIVAQALAEVRP